MITFPYLLRESIFDCAQDRPSEKAPAGGRMAGNPDNDRPRREGRHARRGNAARGVPGNVRARGNMATSPAYHLVKRWEQEEAPSAGIDQNLPLRQLFQLRNIAIVGQLAAVVVADHVFGVILPIAQMLAVIAGLYLSRR